jgi:hypothetical protein
VDPTTTLHPYDPYKDHEEDFFMDLEFFCVLPFNSSGLDRGRPQI